MSPSKNVSRFVAIALAVLTIPALSLVVSPVASAAASCPEGWTLDVNNPAIDGIFCDRLATTNGSFTVPDGIDEINVVAVGGGGGGGGGGQTSILVAGGGGGAGELTQDFIDVVAGDVINYTSGDGGAGGTNVGATSGANGGDTTVSIGSNAAIVVAQGGRGGVNGEDGGAGGAAGGADANLGGAGSSADPAAGGGGGGWFSAGVAGTEGVTEKGGNGGSGYGVQEYPNISHPTHSEYPLWETMNWNTNGNPSSQFLDRMGHGGGGGVVLDSGMDCSGESGQYFGYSIPNEDLPINELGSGSCAIQGVGDYAGALAITAIYAGTGGGGGAGTSTNEFAQPTAGYEGFVYFRIFVPSNTGDSNDENPDCDEDTHEFYDVVGANMQFTEICDLSGVVNDVGLNDESQDDGFDDFGYLNGYNPDLDDPTVNGESFAIRSSSILSNEDGVLEWVAEDVFSVSEQALVDVYYTLTIIENTATWSFEIFEAGTDTPATMDIYIDGGLGSDEETVWSSTNSSSMYSNDGYDEDPILVWKTNGTWESVVQGEDSLRAEWTNSSAGSVNVIAAGYSCGTAAQLNAHAQSILSNFETKKNTVIPVYSQGCETDLASTGVSGDALTAGLAGGIAALMSGVGLVAARRRNALIES